MKKIIIIALSTLTALLTSCNMDKFPHSSILESEGVVSMSDAEQFRVSIYSPMKSLLGGGRYTYEELRGGMFHATVNFGNNAGDLYRWEIQTTSQEAEALWYGDYSGIASINYTIGAYDKLLASAEDKRFTDEEIATLKDYKAEAHMTRALIYWDLVTKFCKAYDPATAEQDLGLPLVTVYNPTSDVTKYPGRSNLAETYKLITDDLNEALKVSTAGKTNSNYWTKDAVKAVLARVQLNMKDWQNAAKNAQDVINSNTYTLASSQSDMEGLFSADLSNELIFVVAGSLNDKPTSTGGDIFINDGEKGDGSTPDPRYIPSKTLLDLYDKENDLRYPIFYQDKEITIQGSGTETLALLWKFSGNPIYQSTAGKLNYINAGKIRLAEMYLTLAEAAANIGGSGLATAQTALNTLRAARISDYTDETYTEREIMPAIKAEWSREFIGEGFRMINMKRWNDNIDFGEPQYLHMVYRNEDFDSLNKEIAHSRCLWPIPKKEMDVNPQMKGQQNPGY